ncbi:4'-phosphopantetheinyl transferase superfamily protein [Streptomyces sp. SID8014]|uniref:4'-phosphopantetheinyl transferase family protein n=1 Tax=Streptomyces sp. SID8014 TaxID=2706097 RepID=UPI0013BC2D65|nr:4'-phosphopantetheinyl transferase superfamily protein [Streptomyces sp. SID8014]NEC14990.1 4'-phosphopantetheinyl transferase superfamily protein [Streptomyces sp. SID8014]
MLGTILPEGLSVVETREEAPEATLYPEEAAVVARAVHKRRAEFATVRHCARRAMAELGLPPAPLLPGERGAPRWPGGVVGSMTHCAGYRAAVVGLASRFRSVGVDAEPHDTLPEGVLDMIALPAERERHTALCRDRPEVHWDRLLFSAKESVYKAWFPLTGRWLDFSEADIVVEPGTGPTGSFAVRLLVPGHTTSGEALTGFSGRWRVEAGVVCTAIAVPAPARSKPPAPRRGPSSAAPTTPPQP